MAKKSGLVATTVAAVSASAVSVSSSSDFSCNSKFQLSHQESRKDQDASQESVSTNKFAPRFDGLRFIETLVTAHR